MEAGETLIAIEPVWVSVAVSEAGVPTPTLPKARLDGVSVAACVLFTPVPDSVTDFVPAPVTTLSVPLLLDAPVGRKLTSTVQVAPTASEVAQVVEEKLKYVPETELAVGAVTVSATAPVFVSVAVSVLVVLRSTLPNARGDGVSVAIWVLLTPVPDRLVLSLPAPVLIVNFPVRDAAAVGKNFTLTAQLDPTGREARQVVDTKLKLVPITELLAGTVTLTATAPVFASVAVSVLD
jgi:hypothetical protein